MSGVAHLAHPGSLLLLLDEEERLYLLRLLEIDRSPIEGAEFQMTRSGELTNRNLRIKRSLEGPLSPGGRQSRSASLGGGDSHPATPAAEHPPRHSCCGAECHLPLTSTTWHGECHASDCDLMRPPLEAAPVTEIDETTVKTRRRRGAKK